MFRVWQGGSGSLTIRMLLGLIRPTYGQVRIFDQQFPHQRLSILRRVGSLVESPSYYGHLTGRENLIVFARLLHVSQQRVDEVLSIVRLTAAENKTVNGYWLGMKQRLGVHGIIPWDMLARVGIGG